MPGVVQPRNKDHVDLLLRQRGGDIQRQSIACRDGLTLVRHELPGKRPGNGVTGLVLLAAEVRIGDMEHVGDAGEARGITAIKCKNGDA